MIKNVLKIVFLGVVGFGLLVYLTADKAKNVQAEDSVVSSTINYNSIPKTLEIVGDEKIYNKEELIKANEKTLIIVGNHDSLSIIKDLKKYVKVELPYIMVANISNAPWFIKKWAIPIKLEELNKGTNIPMIYDYDGSMAKALSLDDTTKTKYFAYVLEASGEIKLAYTGSVKEGAIDGSMNDDEIKVSLLPIAGIL